MLNEISAEQAPEGNPQEAGVLDESGKHHAILTRLEWLSYLFDEAVAIPFTKYRIGWDAAIGLIPVVGDAVTASVSGYFLWEAYRLGARKRVLAKMLGNTAIDFTAGAIPLVGDLMDVAWRSNRKNMDALLRELQSQGLVQDDISVERIARLLGEQSQKQQRLLAERERRMPPPLIMP